MIKRLVSIFVLVALGANSAVQAADDTIKVGVLHSLSGTMAISETTLKDTILMMIEQQNEDGGLLGKQLAASHCQQEDEPGGARQEGNSRRYELVGGWLK